MSALVRQQAKDELRLFSLGAAGGTGFVVVCLFVFQGFMSGILMFLWVATRIEYVVVIAFVTDVVMQEPRPGRPRFLPVTAVALGLCLPVSLVALRYMI